MCGAPRRGKVEAHHLDALEQLLRRPHRTTHRRQQPRTTQQLIERGAAEVGIGSAQDERRRCGAVTVEVACDGPSSLTHLLHSTPHAAQLLQ